MLILIGLGLETKDISVRALDALRAADAVLLEKYTAFLPDKYVEYLRGEAKAPITEVQRQGLEDDVKKTVASAKSKDVAILFPGDPLAATTHKIILDEAAKAGVECKVFHSVSILTVAIGESGLNFYRFGPVVTVPFWSERYKPTSFIGAIGKNVKNDEHTLLLLDIDQKNRRPMSFQEALRILDDADRASGADLLKGRRVIVIGNAGMATQETALLEFGRIGVKETKRFEGKVLSLILPAKTDFAEEESLTRL